MSASTAKATLLSVLDRVAGGDEVEITKHGRVVARLVPANSPHALRGLLSGVASTVGTDDDVFSTGGAWDTGDVPT
jgi:prevent-host-death family protein